MKTRNPNKQEIKTVIMEEEGKEVAIAHDEKRIYLFLSFLLLLFGIAELVASILVIISTGGGHIAGIYVGGCTILLSFRGFFLNPGLVYRMDLVLQFLNILIAIVGTAMQAALYNFIITFEACSSYSSSSSSKSTSCSSVPSNYYCYGNSDYFSDAVVCEATYIDEYGVTSDECTCISSENTSSCYSYTSVADCNDLLNEFPQWLEICVVFDVLCLLTNAIFFWRLYLCYRRYSSNKANDEKTDNAQNPSESVNPIQNRF